MGSRSKQTKREAGAFGSIIFMYLPDQQGNQHLVKLEAPRRLKIRAKMIKKAWQDEQMKRLKDTRAREAGERERRRRAKLKYKLTMLWRRIQFWRTFPDDVKEW